MASLDDILTAQKNGVVALNNIGQVNLRGLGTQTSATVTGTTFVIAGAGYLVNFSVLVAGTGAGTGTGVQPQGRHAVALRPAHGRR